jgi:hypothetical protein
MNIRPSFTYRFLELLRGSATFLIIFLLVMAGLSVSVSGTTVVGGYEISACIYFFVMGIITIREDLRLGIQNGVGRRSVFLASLLSSALTALIFAVLGEILITAAQALTKNMDNFLITGLYQILSSPQASLVGEPTRISVSIGAHLAAILLIFVLLVGPNLFGSFISLVFYRLNKRWTVIVAVASRFSCSGSCPLCWPAPTSALAGPPGNCVHARRLHGIFRRVRSPHRGIQLPSDSARTDQTPGKIKMKNENGIVFEAKEDGGLLDCVRRELSHLPGGRVKSFLEHRLISVDGLVTSKYDYPVKRGQTIRIRQAGENSYHSRWRSCTRTTV